MRVVILTGLGLLFSPVALAQSPILLASSVESGWTSNATESVDGTPDFYVQHTHEAALAEAMGPLVLRGALMVEHQTFRDQQGENDLSVTAALEAGLTLSDSVSLRLGYGVTRDWIGEIVDLGVLTLTLNSPATTHEMLAELSVAGADRAGAIGVEVWRLQPGLSRFEGLPLEPAQLDPEVMQIRSWLAGEWALSPQMAGLARLQWTIAGVPELDRFVFGREPASAAQLSGGLRLRQGIVTAEARAGVDMVWPQAATDLVERLPYLEADLALALTEQLSLTARGFLGVELFKPNDGVASRRMEAELGARLALTDYLTLNAGIALTREQGLYDDSIESSRRSAQAGLSARFAPGLEAGLVASHADVDEPGGSYSVRTIGFKLSGRV